MTRTERWRILIATWLRRLADRLDLPPIEDGLVCEARALCALQDRDWPDRSGEAKRHQVYAALLKLFPSRTKREISKAIEDAL